MIFCTWCVAICEFAHPVLQGRKNHALHNLALVLGLAVGAGWSGLVFLVARRAPPIVSYARPPPICMVFRRGNAPVGCGVRRRATAAGPPPSDRRRHVAHVACPTGSSASRCSVWWRGIFRFCVLAPGGGRRRAVATAFRSSADDRGPRKVPRLAHDCQRCGRRHRCSGDRVVRKSRTRRWDRGRFRPPFRGAGLGGAGLQRGCCP